MADVIVIGGGLSGLAAAAELTRRGVRYTLIEVKKRLGGSIVSERRAGCVLDGGAFALPRGDDWGFLGELDLPDALFALDESHVAFKDGAQCVVDALARRVTAPVMHRMAVHSLGRMPGAGFGVCLENGIVLNARALVVAAPAHYAAIMFRELQPEIAHRLAGVRYDTITRVSLVYRDADAPRIPDAPPHDYPIVFIHHTRSAQRVPPGHVLVQVGVRGEPLPGERRDWVGELAALFGWSSEPVCERVDFWAEADPLFIPTPDGVPYADNLRAVHHLLPDGVGLAGSDYGAGRLSFAARIAQGRAAAARAGG